MKDVLTCVLDTEYSDYFDDADKDSIFLLNEGAAKDVWNRKIHYGSSSFFNLPNDCWIAASKSISIGRWIEAYNKGDAKIVEKLLREAVDWSDDWYIYFLARSKVVFRMQWNVFLRHWDSLISIEDDCPIVIVESAPRQEAILFRPIGDILKKEKHIEA